MIDRLTTVALYITTISATKVASAAILFLLLIVHVADAQDAAVQDAAESGIEIFDLETASDRERLKAEVITVDRQDSQYLGHPTTCLLEDGKTILCVYPKGHGRGPIVYKRSADGGQTWSKRLPTPENWKSSKETPTLHRVTDKQGTKRVIMFSGLHPIRMAVSEDDGTSWSELKKIGDFGGIVAMSSVFSIKGDAGNYLAMFHDDGRFIGPKSKQEKPVRFTVYKTRSRDGGLSWSIPTTVISSTEMHLCEPGIIRSPDGKQILCLLRENSRKKRSQMIFSNDEGETWSQPKPLADELQGDRHTIKYLPNGNLFVSLRCNRPKALRPHPFQGDWVAWVGTYQQLVAGDPGEMFIRLQDNTKVADCAYPGVEVLPDGTVVTTTYGHWEKDKSPYILAIRLQANQSQQPTKP